MEDEVNTALEAAARLRAAKDEAEERLGKLGLISESICANKECSKFAQEAVMKFYPTSVYCSLNCKYSDTDPTHKETYGD